jgi:hypothetical protein
VRCRSHKTDLLLFTASEHAQQFVERPCHSPRRVDGDGPTGPIRGNRVVIGRPLSKWLPYPNVLLPRQDTLKARGD